MQWAEGVTPCLGAVFAGSLARGGAGPSSHLDLVVLQEAAGRRRVQRKFADVPVELFFNSRGWLTAYLHEEPLCGRPVMTHMLATGVVIADTNGQLAAICREAKETIRAGAQLTPERLTKSRYRTACLVEDALDFGAVDSPDARRMRALAVEALIEYAFLQKNQFLPRPKERLHVLSLGEPRLAGGLALALSAPATAVAQSALRNAAHQILGTAGFFEWESADDPGSPAEGGGNR